MSLNPGEQRIFDYLQGNPDEGRFWREKIRAAVARTGDLHALAARLDLELRQYHKERSAVVAHFRDKADRDSMHRMSMRNLAELLLRLWTDPKPKKAPPAEEDALNK